MAELPRLTGREMLAALRRAGWYETRVRGSHHRLKHDARVGAVTVPAHAGQVLSAKTVRNIMRQAGMTVVQLRQYL